MGSIRDSQRKKLYDAEHAAFDVDDRSPDFSTLAECQDYADYVTHSDTWKALGFSHLPAFQEPAPVTVTDGRGRRRGGASSFAMTIKAPKWTRMDYYIVHELAHIATEYIHDFIYDEYDEDGGGWPGKKNPKTGLVELTSTTAAHGPEYAGVYLHLVRGILGDKAAQRLLESFEEYRVKHTPPDVVTDTDTVPVTDAVTEPDVVSVTDTYTESVTDNVTHCLTCSMGLSTVLRAHKFCSNRCRYRYHSARRSERTAASREKVCEACGVAFRATRSDAKTCSPKCRQRLKRSSA
jgi:predicted nucleic acid-binding Zn ribbon protein